MLGEVYKLLGVRKGELSKEFYIISQIISKKIISDLLRKSGRLIEYSKSY